MIVDAARMAREEGLVVSGFPFVNVSMVGAILRATGVATLESGLSAVAEVWKGELADRNSGALRKAYDAIALEGARAF
jgi:pyruvate ferredoxin oxidoreductase gamma subunit